eukprot:1017768-Pleurochrysis_carterae.AAC.1
MLPAGHLKNGNSCMELPREVVPACSRSRRRCPAAPPPAQSESGGRVGSSRHGQLPSTRF